MKNMKHTKLIALLATSIAFLTACDESTTENITQVNQVGMDVVSAEKDLPECTAENEGAQAFVKGESSARVCVGEEWVPMASSVKDTVVLSGDTVYVAGDTVYLAGGKDTVYVKGSDLSCKTEPLADSSGLKIVCNGDSIGVVLNGAKGEKGDTGEPGDEGKPGDPGSAGIGCSIAGQTDSTMTVACGTDTTTIQLNYSKADEELESSVDFYQKGFFLKGSTTYLYELSDGRTLRQTGTPFVSRLTLDDGFIGLNTRDLISQYAMVIFDGFYRNVVTGKKSSVPISLNLISDVTERTSLNANLLTHLEYDRIHYLVTQKKMRVKNAKKQAQAEVLKQFVIDTTGLGAEEVCSEDIAVFDTAESSARLLALTVLLQGDRSEAEFTELLTEIADDISEDGKWDNLEKKMEIANWAKDADESGRLDKIRENIVKGADIVFPDFVKYIRPFYKAELGDGK